MRNTTCRFCGAVLQARVLTICGRSVQCGFEECMCEAASKEREVAAKLEALAAQKEQERKLAEAVRKAGVMPRYERAEHPMAAELGQELERGRNIYIFGDVGTMKTHLASATARILVQHGVGVKFSAMRNVLDEIKDSFRKDGNPLAKYQGAKVLMLDDFDKESPTDFALERMFALIDERSVRMLPTLVTTQYRPSRLVERLSKNGDDITAKAIVSRLRQDCRVIELGGGDRRLG